MESGTIRTGAVICTVSFASAVITCALGSIPLETAAVALTCTLVALSAVGIVMIHAEVRALRRTLSRTESDSRSDSPLLVGNASQVDSFPSLPPLPAFVQPRDGDTDRAPPPDMGVAASFHDEEVEPTALWDRTKLSTGERRPK